MEGMSPFVANLYVQLNSPVANLRDVVKVLLENDLIMNITTTVRNADGLACKGMICLATHTLSHGMKLFNLQSPNYPTL